MVALWSVILVQWEPVCDTILYSVTNREKIRNLRQWGCLSHDQLCVDQCNQMIE
eukprot:COSAG01_NODE_6233_length_3777_cov_2.172648_6_plen_54_part_00